MFDDLCGFIPAGEIAPLGFGVEMKAAAYCKMQLHWRRDIIQGAGANGARAMSERHSKEASKDCGRTAEFNRQRQGTSRLCGSTVVVFHSIVKRVLDGGILA